MKRLKLLREERGITQQEAADAIGLERSLYARYEYGTRIPPIVNLIKLSKFYGVTTDYLLELTDVRGQSIPVPEPTTIAAHTTTGMDPISPERLQEIIDQAVLLIKREAAKNMKKDGK